MSIPPGIRKPISTNQNRTFFYKEIICFLLFFSAVFLLPKYSLAFTGKELAPIKLVTTIGGKEGKSRLRQPSSVLVSGDGRLFVLDGAVNRVAVFSKSGKFLYEFGTAHLDRPLGMTMDANGRLYVTDTGKGRIQIFSSKGKHLKKIDLPKEKRESPTEPVDVAIDNERGILYIVDNNNHRILIYSLKKNALIKTIGKMGMGEGELRWPFSIAINKKGVVFVVDVVNTTVRTIHPEDNWAFKYDVGKWGIQKGEFFRPKGVAINSKGELFVSDSYLGVVQIFDEKGRFLSVLSNSDKTIHYFTTPARLFFDQHDRLHVVEMFANRIGIFEINR